MHVSGMTRSQGRGVGISNGSSSNSNSTSNSTSSGISNASAAALKGATLAFHAAANNVDRDKTAAAAAATTALALVPESTPAPPSARSSRSVVALAPLHPHPPANPAIDHEALLGATQATSQHAQTARERSASRPRTPADRLVAAGGDGRAPGARQTRRGGGGGGHDSTAALRDGLAPQRPRGEEDVRGADPATSAQRLAHQLCALPAAQSDRRTRNSSPQPTRRSSAEQAAAAAIAGRPSASLIAATLAARRSTSPLTTAGKPPQQFAQATLSQTQLHSRILPRYDSRGSLGSDTSKDVNNINITNSSLVGSPATASTPSSSDPALPDTTPIGPTGPLISMFETRRQDAARSPAAASTRRASGGGRGGNLGTGNGNVGGRKAPLPRRLPTQQNKPRIQPKARPITPTPIARIARSPKPDFARAQTGVTSRTPPTRAPRPSQPVSPSVRSTTARPPVAKAPTSKPRSRPSSRGVSAQAQPQGGPGNVAGPDTRAPKPKPAAKPRSLALTPTSEAFSDPLTAQQPRIIRRATTEIVSPQPRRISSLTSSSYRDHDLMPPLSSTPPSYQSGSLQALLSPDHDFDRVLEKAQATTPSELFIPSSRPSTSSSSAQTFVSAFSGLSSHASPRVSRGAGPVTGPRPRPVGEGEDRPILRRPSLSHVQTKKRPSSAGHATDTTVAAQQPGMLKYASSGPLGNAGLGLDSLTNAIMASHLASARMAANHADSSDRASPGAHSVSGPRASQLFLSALPLRQQRTADSVNSANSVNSDFHAYYGLAAGDNSTRPSSRTSRPMLRQTMRAPHQPHHHRHATLLSQAQAGVRGMSLSDDDEDERRRHLANRHQGKTHLLPGASKKHSHHEGSRRRWRDEVTARERRRYEAVWASNRGLFLRPGFAFQHPDNWDPPEAMMRLVVGSPETAAEAPASPATTRAAAALTQVDLSRAPDPPEADMVAGVVVRDIWSRSRLPLDELAEVWELVAVDRAGSGGGGGVARREEVHSKGKITKNHEVGHHGVSTSASGSVVGVGGGNSRGIATTSDTGPGKRADRQIHSVLGKHEFVVGMWLIDQRLRGRKLPARVSDSVWDSARGGGIRVPSPSKMAKGR